MNAKSTCTKMVSLILIFSLAVLGVLASPYLPARAGGPYVVDVSYDGPDSNLSDGVCYDGVSGCTLRAALQQASYDGVATTITFDSSLAGTILYLSDTYGTLYVSGSNIIINGDTGPSSYPPLIDGSNLTGGKDIFEIQGNSNTIENLIIRNGPGNGVHIYDPSDSGYASFNTLDYLHIYGNANDGIVVAGGSSGSGQYNLIQHSLIGAANWGQTTCPGDGNSWEGIVIANGADATNINSNTIVCNGNSGIYLMGNVGGQISNTTIQTNMIGTDGTNDMGNGLSGIADQLASGTTIYNNVISGNGNDGIWLNGSTGAILTSNRIGVNQSGTLALPNGNVSGYNGLTISDGAYGNTVGSPSDANARNIISGNTGCGVQIITAATNNVLDGNFIGLGGSDGMVVIPNGLAGVCINGAPNNTLSTNPAAVTQYISGNTREGVYITNSASIFINTATYIGVAGDGNTPAGNQREGVFLDAGTTNSTIAAWKIMYNGLAGINLVGDSSTGNDLIPGMIGYNVGIAIDLGSDGHTANGTHTPPGPNNWMNFPEVNIPGIGSFSGTTCPGCYVRIYQSIGDPIMNNGGGIYMESFQADLVTGDFNYTIPGGVSAVAMMAFDPNTYDCSELSPSVVNSASPTHKIYLPMVNKP